jgi:hypothetical protein
MMLDINEKCCVDSDAYQWIALRKREIVEPLPVAYYRTLSFALDTLIFLGLCAESELVQARAVAAQLESTKRRVNRLLSRHRYVVTPAEITEWGDFMTAWDGINYRFLRQVWRASSVAEIEGFAVAAVLLAEKLDREACALPTSRFPGADFGPNAENPTYPTLKPVFGPAGGAGE